MTATGAAGAVRVVLGLSYRGQAYHGWQSQADRCTVQDRLERALALFCDRPMRTICAGRTDTGVHALNQVVHLVDGSIVRAESAWLRGTNRYLPADIAVQWCRFVDGDFHARNSAHGRRYVYLLKNSAVRPSLASGLIGWSHRPLDGDAMRAVATSLVGEHDFSALRSSECQAASPVKTLRSIDISQRGDCWRFEFDANAYLHHMVRNLMGCLVAVGNGSRDAAWLQEVMASRNRTRAAPTFPAAGLYFRGPYYDPRFAIPAPVDALDGLP